MKTKNLTTAILILLFSVVISYGQSERFFFARTGSNFQINKVKVDSLGNNYIVGTYQSSMTFQNVTIDGNDQSEGDLFILKTSPAGEVIYLRPVYGLGNGDNVYFKTFDINDNGELSIIIQTASASEIMIGQRQFSLDPSSNSKIIAKFSKTGFLSWVKVLTPIGTGSEILPKDLELDEQGNVYIAGDFLGEAIDLDGQNLPGFDTISSIFLVKYTSNGDFSWSSSCDIIDTTVSGGIYAEELEISPDGNIYIYGTQTGRRGFIINQDTVQCIGISNAYLACYNSNGNPQWAIPFEADNYVIPKGLAIDKSGNIGFACFYKANSLLVDGNNYSSLNDYDLLINHINAEGIFNWLSPLNTNMTTINTFNGNEAVIGFNNSGNLYLAGEYYNTTNNIYFFSFSGESGAIENNLVTIGPGDAYLDNVIIDKKGNILTSGNTYSGFNIGTYTIEDLGGYGTSYLLRVLSDGTIDYVHQQENSISDYVSFDHLGVDAYNNSFIVGNYSGTGARLDEFTLSDDFPSGIFTSEYGNIGSIKGKVIDFFNEPVPGEVKLIVYTNYQKSPLSDSVIIQADGSFEFLQVPLGKYLIQVIPENTSETNYLTTYFPSMGIWEDAAHVIIDKSNLDASNIFIIVPEQEEFTGTGGLSGVVNEVEEDDLFKSTQQKPKKKGNAKLAKSRTKSDWDIISITETDENGNYAFSNVSIGTYAVFIDIPGIAHDEIYDIEITEGQHVGNIDYLIEEDKITATNPQLMAVDKIIIKLNSQVKLYPNPSSGEVYISASEGENIQKLVIQDLQGKTLKSYNSVTNSVALSDLPAGIYFANVITDRSIETIKFVITQ